MTKRLINTGLPTLVRVWGYVAVVGALPLASRLSWEQTAWSWEQGPQMVGFALAHTVLAMQMSTNGLTALITGLTSGIGRATANKLAELGIHVLVVGRNLQRGENSCRSPRSGR